jgi:hypothetical protein
MDVYLNRAWRVRALMWGSLVFAGAFLSLSWAVLTRQGLDENGAGVLSPLGERLAWAALSAAIGAAAVAAMWIYGRFYYVSALRWRPEDQAIEVETIGWLGYPGRVIPLADVAGSRTVVENFTGNAGFRQTVMWDALRLRGRRLPLILDFGGEVLDERAYDALLEGRAPDALPAPAAAPDLAKSHRDMTSARRKRNWRRKKNPRS